jgi:hypothetical protein
MQFIEAEQLREYER